MVIYQLQSIFRLGCYHFIRIALSMSIIGSITTKYILPSICSFTMHNIRCLSSISRVEISGSTRFLFGYGLYLLLSLWIIYIDISYLRVSRLVFTPLKIKILLKLLLMIPLINTIINVQVTFLFIYVDWICLLTTYLLRLLL